MSSSSERHDAAITCGDFDSNGVVATADVVLLLSYVLAPDPLIDHTAGRPGQRLSRA